MIMHGELLLLTSMATAAAHAVLPAAPAALSHGLSLAGSDFSLAKPSVSALLPHSFTPAAPAVMMLSLLLQGGQQPAAASSSKQQQLNRVNNSSCAQAHMCSCP
jgi:hypothetical protein